MSEYLIFSNINWVMDFFLDLSGSGEHSTIDTLFGSFIIIPDSSILQFLFGKGISLFGKSGGSSDMGFILQLNYGGFIFVLMIIFFIYYTSIRLVKTVGVTHWFTLLYILLIITLNIKGFIFAATPGGRLLFLMYMLFILNAQSNYNLKQGKINVQK